MYAIAQIRYKKLDEVDTKQQFTFQRANLNSLEFFYKGELQINDHWNYPRFSQLLLGGQDQDYGFYLILR